MTMRAFAFVLGTALLSGTAGEAVTVFSASGAAPADIQATVDAFRAALGTLNGNLPENFAGGRREVNWDGVPDANSDPNPFPGDFFNGDVPGRARGIEFTPTGTSTGLSVSASAASGVPVEFGESDIYTVFSPEKIFEPVGGTTLDVQFFDPTDQTTTARVLGFGSVFTGLPTDVPPTLTFFGPGGTDLGTFSVDIVADAGLSFLGVVFDDPFVERVAIDTGEESVMDDFIYGEPAPIPLPAGAVLLGSALAMLGAARMRRG